jgi:hypothetical protein
MCRRWLMRSAVSLRVPKPAAPEQGGPRRAAGGAAIREWAGAVKEAVAMHRGALAWLASDDYASLS